MVASEPEVLKMKCEYSSRIEAAPLREVPLFRQMRQPLGRQRQPGARAHENPAAGICGALFTPWAKSRIGGSMGVVLSFYLSRCEKGFVASFILMPYELGVAVCIRSSGLV